MPWGGILGDIRIGVSAARKSRVARVTESGVKTVTVPLERPVRQFYDGERARTVEGSKRELTESQVHTITLFALAATVFGIFRAVMWLARYAILEPAAFATLHPGAALAGFVASILYIAAFYLKGFTYWLIYLPPVLAGIMAAVTYAMIKGWLAPEDLSWMLWAPDWMSGA